MSFFQDLFEGLTADYALKPEDFERASQASTRRPSSTDEENQGGDGGGNGSGNSGVSVKAIVQQIEERKWGSAAEVTATAPPAAAFAPATLTSSSSSSCSSSSSSSVVEPPSSASASAPVPPPAGSASAYGTDGAAGEEDGASIFDSVLSGATGMVSSLLAGDFEWTHEKETKKEEAYFEEPGPSPLDDEEHWYAEQVKKGVSSSSSSPLRAAESAAEVNLQEWTNPEAIASSSAELVRDAGRSSPSSTPRDVFTSATSSSATAVPSAVVPVGTTVPSSGSSSSWSSSTSALPTSLPSKPARKRDFTMVSGSQFEAVMRIEKECYDRDATVSEEAEDEQLVEPPSAAGQTSAAEDAPGKTPKSSAPTLESHLEQFFWRFPEYRADVRQLGDGAYSVSGRRVGLQINERNQVEVRDGPMRQVLEDYIGGNLTTAVYANSHLQPGAVSSTSTSTAAPYVADADSQRKVSFDDQDQVYNRIEAMRVAKEQAKARLLSATSAVGGGAASERESFERYRRWHQVALQKEAPIDAYGNKIDIDTGRVSAYGGYWGGGASWFGGTGDSSGRAGEYYAGEGGANRITAENRQGTEVLTAPVLLGGGIGMGGPMGSYTNL
eukprot:CAMPEP_0178984590 /NCGR_PEP_ID=MMETSP0795-20121207/1693_1 /TAXON_ID=88552 /ORGANISM="Amoebophrya sp., Strain Ameob2" /LENGTH=610 /DNA_ID=CAMNT_0020675477 /DNA_START=16 /DNA_END=1848 /DNA_ORIENTATION=-